MGKKLKFEEDLSTMALNLDGLLALVEDHLIREVCNQDDQPVASQLHGLTVAVESAREIAGFLFGALDSIETYGHRGREQSAPEVVESLTDEELRRFLSKLPEEGSGRLTEEQRELIRDLAEDIAGGNVSPLQVATRNSARFALARLAAETAKLSPEECVAELASGEIHVSMRMSDPDGDPYAVTETWTLKGLRERVAKQRLLDSITGNPDQDAWRDQ